jgi:hypothetical protein
VGSVVYDGKRPFRIPEDEGNVSIIDLL